MPIVIVAIAESTIKLVHLVNFLIRLLHWMIAMAILEESCQNKRLRLP